MNDRERTPVAVAIRLWDSAAATCADAADTATVIDVVLARLESGLRRWIGAEGYAALLSRAMAHVVPTHPALTRIVDLGVPGSDSEVAIPDNAADDSGAERRDAIIALLSAMMQQLGGIIGDNMAIRLFEQTITPSQRGTAGVESNESSS